MHTTLKRPQAVPQRTQMIAPRITVPQLSALFSMNLAATTPENTRIDSSEMWKPPATAGKHQDRADRDVESPGHDDEGHAHGHHLEHRHVERDVADVGDRRERV